MFDWFDMQWRRFNLWLDCKRDYPGEKVKILHVGNGVVRAFRMRELTPEEVQAAEEQGLRRDAFLTPEQREQRARRVSELQEKVRGSNTSGEE